MGKWSIGFALLLTLMILGVSYSHTVSLYTDIGYGQSEAFTITAFIEGIFLLSTVTLARNRLAGQHSSWTLKCGFAYGAFHVLFSNLHHSADLSYLFDSGIAGWVLGISILVGLIIIELIVSYGVSENKRTEDGQDTKQTDNKPSINADSVRKLNENKLSESKRTDVVFDSDTDRTGIQGNGKRTDEAYNVRPEAVQTEVSVQEETDSAIQRSGSTPVKVLYTDERTVTNTKSSGQGDINEIIDEEMSVHLDEDADLPDKLPDSVRTETYEECNERTVDGQGELDIRPDNTNGQQSDNQAEKRTDSERVPDSERTNGGRETDKTERTNGGQHTAGRASEKTKKHKRNTVPEEVVEEVYLSIVKDTGKVPSFRGLMREAGCSKHMAGKVINRYKKEKAG
ncbi:hypothetical protein [Melghirimyces algeriensis]|uniref:DUF2637 domain-containing protein n=1 Tax=Melghirimyces algeriensis TaxID=910412 RepID=A0A521F7T1_9BACL|nr:hypothetical protein [Melghirimyces algeriensis]SMO92255.1 hypothetical protein SAMN06264849_11456 [Melghirimyces algeriensis]